MQLVFGPVPTVPLSKGVYATTASRRRDRRGAAGGSDSSGAERDEDGVDRVAPDQSRWTVARLPRRAAVYLRQTLSGFMNELLTLHGQNDQPRLMRLDRTTVHWTSFALLAKLSSVTASCGCLANGLTRRPSQPGPGTMRKRPIEEIRAQRSTSLDRKVREDGAVADIARLRTGHSCEAATTARATLCGTPDVTH